MGEIPCMGGEKIHPRQRLVSFSNLNGSLDVRRMCPLTGERGTALAGLLPLPSPVAAERQAGKNARGQESPALGFQTAWLFPTLTARVCVGPPALHSLPHPIHLKQSSWPLAPAPPPRWHRGVTHLPRDTGPPPASLSSVAAKPQPEPPRALAAVPGRSPVSPF